jgi:hypothetical protein
MKKLIVLLILMAVIVTSGCIKQSINIGKEETTTTTENKLSCQSKTDCVPATCCHPDSCINKNYKTVCNVLCTQVCEPGTMDCGQGYCDCINYECKAIIKSQISATEQACINSGGTVKTSSCCKAVSDFPNTCLIGACGCAPTSSHEVKVCECPEGKCFDGNTCT